MRYMYVAQPAFSHCRSTFCLTFSPCRNRQSLIAHWHIFCFFVVMVSRNESGFWHIFHGSWNICVFKEFNNMYMLYCRIAFVIKFTFCIVMDFCRSLFVRIFNLHDWIERCGVFTAYRVYYQWIMVGHFRKKKISSIMEHVFGVFSFSFWLRCRL